MKYKNPARFIPFFLFFAAFAIRYHFLSRYFELYDSYGKYEWVAEKIINGEDIGERILDFSPLYTYITAVFQYLFLGNRFFLILFQNILGSLNSLLIYLIGKKLFCRRVGIIAGIIFAFCKNIILYEYISEPITVVIFLNSLTVLLLILTADSIIKKSNIFNRVSLCYISGMLLGLGVITRPNILLFLPFACLWIFISSKNGDGRSIYLTTYYLLFFIGIMTSLSPIMIRNYRVSGNLSLVIMSPGQVFHQGNSIEARGLGIGYPAVLTDIYAYANKKGDYMHEMYRIAAKHSAGKEISFEESSLFWTEKAVNFIKTYTGKHMKIICNKIISFFHPFEMHDIPLVYPKQESLNGFPFLTFTIIAPLSILGIVISWKRKRDNMLAFAIILVYFLSNIIFFVSSRQRLPVIPFLSLFTAYFLRCFLHYIKDKNYKMISASIVFFVILLMIFTFPFQIIRRVEVDTRRLYSIFFSSLYRSNAYIKENNPALASRDIKTAVARYPLKINEFAYGNIFYGDEGLIKGAIRIAETAYPPSKNDIYENYYLGYLYFMAEEYDKADDIFKRSGNQIMLGNICLARGMFDRAIYYYEKALENEEFDLAALSRLVALYDKKGNKKKYLALLNNLKRFYDDISIDYHLGYAFYYTGEHGKAISEWKKIAVFFPEYPIIHILLSMGYAKAGLAGRAYSEFEIAISLKPSLFTELKDLENLLENDIRQNPEDLKLYLMLGRLYKRRGDFNKALSALQKGADIIKENKDYYDDSYIEKITSDISRIYYGLGDEYLVSEDIDMAIQYFEKAKKFNYKEANVYLKLGYSYQYKGLTEQAMKNYNLYLISHPEDAEVYKALGNLYYNRSELLKAKVHYLKCIIHNDEDADCHYNLGLVYFKMNRLTEALSKYIRAIDIDPSKSDFHYNLGLVYKKMGEKKKSDREFNISIRLNKEKQD